MEIVIVIPMAPPRECSPNSRAHWRRRARAAREFRECAYFAALGAGTYPPLAGAVVMDIEVAWPKTRKGMDDDNLIAACKPARDGIADAMFGGEDGSIRVGCVTQSQGDGIVTITLHTGTQ
jgi:hypothetical protein